MTEKFEALFVDGPLDGQIKQCTHHSILAHPPEKMTVADLEQRPLKFTPREITEYVSHKFFVDEQIFHIMGPREQDPLTVFRNLYYGYSDVTTLENSYKEQIRRLETRLARCQLKTSNLQEEVVKLKAKISDLLVGDKE